MWHRASNIEDSSASNFRALLPSKLAAAISGILTKYKSIPNFPQRETCDLLIVDRSVDLVIVCSNIL